ncbi:MAG: TlpA disulfide reductase family protein [Desulfovibrionaceae bacterium]|nr:TlpA disulfide reductase family protein [Desulfovibrionaceae bacterium]
MRRPPVALGPLFWALLAVLILAASPVLAGGVLEPGQTLPEISLQAPPLPAARAELGLSGDGPFSLRDLGCRVLLLEVIGVYCPYCYDQLPGFNSIHQRLKKHGRLGEIRMLAIAAGATSQEALMLMAAEHRGYAFPVVPDERFAAHGLLGEPMTPFTLLVTADGVVRFAHQGVVKDVDALYETMKKLAE